MNSNSVRSISSFAAEVRASAIIGPSGLLAGPAPFAEARFSVIFRLFAKCLLLPEWPLILRVACGRAAS